MGRSVSLLVTLAAAIAWTSCSGGDDGGGGSGGTGGDSGSAPISFDANNALPAASGSVVTIAVAAELGGLLGAAIGALADTPPASLGLASKADINLTCPGGGGARLSYSLVAVGQQATLTFTGCIGSVFSGQAIEGTIEMTIEAVTSSIVGPFPSEATATVNLTAGGDTTITGSFKVLASLSGTLVDLSLGNQLNTDTLTTTRTTPSGPQTIEFACFKIRQVISVLTGTLGGAFEPVGVVRINGDVFTLNNYTTTPPSLTFASGVAISGNVELGSGDGTVSGSRPGTVPGAFCAPFGNTPSGDNSVIATSFTGAACVQVTGQDASGNPIDYETTWGKLLNADFSPGGATCGSTTEAVAGPEMCDLGGTDRLPIADTYITGNGPEPDRMLAGTNFGAASNLLVKSGTNLGFTRKAYLVFDLSDLSATVQTATLVLTLQTHVQGPTPEQSGPKPFDFYGITDDNDWDPDTLPEADMTTGITWNNAPRNSNDWRIPFEQSPAIPLLIAGYDFMLGGDADQDENGVDDDGTRYAFDFTDYINERITNDLDDKVTILIAHPNPTGANVNTSTFFSKEYTEECDRPFLRLE